MAWFGRSETVPTDEAIRYVDITAVVSLQGNQYVARGLEVPVAVYGTTVESACDALERAVQAVLVRSAELGELEQYLSEHRLTAGSDLVRLDPGKFYARIEVPIPAPALALA